MSSGIISKKELQEVVKNDLRNMVLFGNFDKSLLNREN
jgi:hypothetical protein